MPIEHESTAGTAAPTADARSQLRREMGVWDVLLFNIAAVLGPRWIAAAAHNGTSSLSLWALAALLFFVPSALVIVELSTRFPHEGGLYIWTKEAFGDFHGFVAGWCYWIYTFFYFPGLLMASVAMSVYIGGPKYAWLADSRAYLIPASLAVLALAMVLNLIGLQIGKWLQNAGGVGTYLPLMMLVIVAGVLWLRTGSVTAFTRSNVMPHWNWGTVNFWSQIAFAFTGMELVCSMGEEVKAFVVTRSPVDVETLMAFCRESLANYKTPSQIEFVNALPRNAVGKIDKKELRRQHVH